MTFGQFLTIIRARWRLVAAIFLFTVTATFLISVLLPKTYEATATVMADAKPDPVALTTAGVLPSTYLATQVDIIKSQNVARRVVRNLHLDENPSLQTRWQKEAKGKGDYVAWVAGVIAKGLEVKPSRESNVIDITYGGAEPAFAAAIANAYAKAYMESTVQIKVDPARQYAEFFEERARLAREKLEQAQARLAKAQNERGITATEERLDVETQRLNDLSAQVTGLRALRAETSSRNSQAKTNADQMQDVLNSPLIAGLKSDLARAEARLQELLERYGDAHPSVVEARANLKVLRERVNSETAKVTTSLGVNNNVAGSRESQAKSAYEEQRQRVLKLKDARNQLAVLEREVETAQRIYDSIQSRLSQTAMEGSSSQSSVYLLNAATEPTSPSSPKVTLNTALSILVGLLVAMMVALAIEMFDHRIRGPQDIVQALDLPVIGVLPSPHGKTNRFRLPKKAAPPPSLTHAAHSAQVLPIA